jgi:ribonuclease-3
VRGGSNGGAAGEPDGSELLRAIDTGLSPGLLERALTHRSYAYENGGLPTNERLEFLGDAVLGLIVTDTLFRKYPDLPEGQLAKLRAAVVQMRALADVARSLRLGSYVRLGRGEEGTGGRDKSSILADTLEALIGAVYFECGLSAAHRLVHRLFDPVIDRSAGLGAGLDWKTSLQELTASGFLGVPEYHVEESGPDHQKFFRASVRVAGRTYGSGSGRSKKEAEQQAAEAAWKEISNGTGSSANVGAANGTAAGGTAPIGTAGDGTAANGAVAGGAAGSGSLSASGGPSPLANGAHPASGDAGAAAGAPGNDAGAAAPAPGNVPAGPGAGAAPVPPVPPASPVPPAAEGGAEPAGD